MNNNNLNNNSNNQNTNNNNNQRITRIVILRPLNNNNPIFHHFTPRYTPETNVYLNNTVFYLTVIENAVNLLYRIQEHRRHCPRCIIHSIRHLAKRPLHINWLVDAKSKNPKKTEANKEGLRKRTPKQTNRQERNPNRRRKGSTPK